MIPRALYSLALALLAYAIPSFAQTGVVTFYSIAPSVSGAAKSIILPAGVVPFNGWLFDGDHRLAHVRRGNLMSFRLAAGEHDFTVPYHPNHPGKTGLHLKIEPDGHYCVRLSAKYKSGSVMLPVAWLDSQIEQVSCQEALRQAEKCKPIDIKRVDPAARRELESSPGFSVSSPKTAKHD